ARRRGAGRGSPGRSPDPGAPAVLQGGGGCHQPAGRRQGAEAHRSPLRRLAGNRHQWPAGRLSLRTFRHPRYPRHRASGAVEARPVASRPRWPAQGRLPAPAGHLQSAAQGRSGGALRLPDGAGQGDPRRGTDRTDARLHVRRLGPRPRQPVERRRPRHREAHGKDLQPPADRQATRRGVAAPGAARDGPAGRAALLLGRILAARGVAVMQEGETGALPSERGEPRGQGLTREALEALLAALGPNRETAGVQYEEIRRKLVRLFEWRGCTSPDDLADETINRVARRMAEGVELRSADPYGYFCGVAHLVYKEVMRRQAREIAALESG